MVEQESGTMPVCWVMQPLLSCIKKHLKAVRLEQGKALVHVKKAVPLYLDKNIVAIPLFRTSGEYHFLFSKETELCFT